MHRDSLDGELSDSDDDMDNEEEIMNDPRLKAKSMDDVDDDSDEKGAHVPQRFLDFIG